MRMPKSMDLRVLNFTIHIILDGGKIIKCMETDISKIKMEKYMKDGGKMVNI